MSNVASKAKYFIDCSQGSKQLRKVKSGDFKDESKTAVVTAVGVDGGAGFQDSPGGGTITLEVYGETGREEVDWYVLRDSKEEFTITRQIVGGRRTQGNTCRVSNIAEKEDDGGSVMRTVEIVCLRFKQVAVVG